MKKQRAQRFHAPGLFEQLLDRLRGNEQKLVRPIEEYPLLLLRFPPNAQATAEEIELAYTHLLGNLHAQTRALYEGLLKKMPAMVVVQLCARNPCGCLGHHHPPGTESRHTRRLAAELGSTVGEIDLAYEAIREWQPQPLSALAVNLDEDPRFKEPRFRVALLAVMLHELEHLANPDGTEMEVRQRSNRFYEMAMQEIVADEAGSDYGIASRSPRP